MGDGFLFGQCEGFVCLDFVLTFFSLGRVAHGVREWGVNSLKMRFLTEVDLLDKI